MLLPEVCLEYGGHCWVDNGWVTDNGHTQTGAEYCKHCPSRRRWESQAPRKYTMIDPD